VACGLATVVNFAHPDEFVMGCGMSSLDEFSQNLPHALPKPIFSTVFHTPILRNDLGQAIGLRGAACLRKD
jgi:predicted NBD/HSP70 family sugar kinase